MATIVTRSGKGSPLTNTEVDANFTNLNTDKLESGDTAGSLTITSADINGGTIDGTVIGGATPAAGSFTSLTATSTDATITLTGTRGTGDTHTIATAGANSQNLNISADDSIFLRTSDTIQRVGIFAGGDIAFYEDTGTTPKFFWDASEEKLGLGSASFAGYGPLQLGSTSATSSDSTLQFLASSAAASYIQFGDTTAADAGRYSGYIGYLHSSDAMRFATSATEAMRIDSSGNVGIGTTSPAYKLEIAASQPWIRLNDTDGTTAYAEILTSSGSLSLSANPLGTGVNSYITAITGGSEAMRITSAGDVGIGTSSPQEKATISTTGTSQDVALQLLATNSAGGQSCGVKLKAITSGSASGAGTLAIENRRASLAYEEAMRIDSNGVLNIKNTGSTADFISETATSFIVGDGSGTEAMTVYSGTANNGALYFADGSTGNATYRGGVQYLHGSDAMRFFTSSAEVMRIDSSGNVGIGTSSPGAALDVAGSVNADGLTVDLTSGYARIQDLNSAVVSGTNMGGIEWRTGDSSVSGANRITARIRAEGDGTFDATDKAPTKLIFSTHTTSGVDPIDRMAIDSSGNIVQSPASQGSSYVANTSTTWNAFEIFQDRGVVNAATGIAFRSQSGTAPSGIASIALNTTGGREELAFLVSAGNATYEAMRISEDRNVGIGTTNPVRELQVGDNTGSEVISIQSSTSTNGSIYFGDNTATSAEYAGVLRYAHSDDSMQFWTSSTERMRINSSGKVSIGTTATPGDLNVYDSGTDTRIYLQHSGTGTATSDGLLVASISSNAYLWNYESGPLIFATSNQERARIESSGRVGIGNDTSGAAERFQVSTTNDLNAQGYAIATKTSGTGTINHFRMINGNGVVGSITTNASTTSFNTSSDARLKENIADAEDASSLVDAIKVRQFDWKADGSHQRYGMVAQELLEVAPEAVSGDPESDDMMGVDYSKLVPMLVKEIQSLRARVAQLEGA